MHVFTLLLILTLWLGSFLTVLGLVALIIICKRDEKETLSSLLAWSLVTSLGTVIIYCALQGLQGL